MWNPRRFLRNVFALSFVAVLLFLPMGGLLGPVVAVAMLFFAPVAAAAFYEGLKYALGSGASPAATRIWRASKVMAEVYLSFTVIVSAFLAFGAPDFLFWLGNAQWTVIVFVYGTITLIAFVLIRWSYTWGVNLTLEKQNNNMG